MARCAQIAEIRRVDEHQSRLRADVPDLDYVAAVSQEGTHSGGARSSRRLTRLNSGEVNDSDADNAGHQDLSTASESGTRGKLLSFSFGVRARERGPGRAATHRRERPIDVAA